MLKKHVSNFANRLWKIVDISASAIYFSMLPNWPDNGIVIVFSPLKALIKDKVWSANNLSRLNLKASPLDYSIFNILSNGSQNAIQARNMVGRQEMETCYLHSIQNNLGLTIVWQGEVFRGAFSGWDHSSMKRLQSWHQ